MDQHFVTYNQAVALKELRFDEPCFSAFINEKLRGSGWIKPEVDGMFQNSIHPNIIQNLVSAPLKSQALDWFRTTYGLAYSHEIKVDNGSYFMGFVIIIHRLEPGMRVFDEDDYLIQHWTDDPGELSEVLIDSMIELIKLDKDMNSNNQIGLINYEGDCLKAVRLGTQFEVLDQWNKKCVTLSAEGLRSFLDGSILIKDSAGKAWCYPNESGKIDRSSIESFIDAKRKD